MFKIGDIIVLDGGNGMLLDENSIEYSKFEIIENNNSLLKVMFLYDNYEKSYIYGFLPRRRVQLDNNYYRILKLHKIINNITLIDNV